MWRDVAGCGLVIAAQPLRPHHRQDRQRRERPGGDHQIGQGPVRLISDDQRAAARRDHRAAIPPQIRRRERTLRFGRGRKLDPPRIGGHFERGGPEGEQHREQGGQRQAGVGGGERHRHHCGKDAKLRQHDPAEPLAEKAPEPRHRKSIEQGRPDELEGRQQLHPAEETNQNQVDVMFGEPRRQDRREHVIG